MKKREFGSIFRCKRPDGSRLPNFYVSWTDPEGRRHQRVAGPTRESAETLLGRLHGEQLVARQLTARAGGTRLPHDPVALSRSPRLPLVTHCMAVWHAWQSTLAPGTLRCRKSAVGRWIDRLGNAPLESITKASVQECVRKMRRQGLSASTVKTEVQVLSAAFETLKRECSVPLPAGNPCHGLTLPPVHANARRHRPPADIGRFLKTCPESIRGPVTLLIDCGLRPAELYRLTWAEVALDLGQTGAIRPANTKTYRSRTIPLTPRAREVLAQARAAAPDAQVEGLVFRLGKKAFEMAFRETRSQAGLKDLRPYDLRHAFACTLLGAHVPIAVVRDLLGHANIGTTDIYLRSLPGDATEAAVAALTRVYGATGTTLPPQGPPASPGPT